MNAFESVGYGPDDRGSIPVKSDLLSTPHYPDRFWGPPSLLSNGCTDSSFPRDKAAGAWSWPLTSI